jgi:predicted Zn-dependent peptidase
VISVRTFALRNGLPCHYLHDPLARAASVQVWYRVGSAHETERIHGIAHLLEHLSFKGTARVGPEEHMRLIQNEGGQSNAFTTEEITAMHQTLPADAADLALKLEADRMENLSLSPEAFDRERSIVLEEYKERIENQPLSAAVTRLRRKLFGSHPYAHDPAGTRESLASITLEDVRDFYQRYYHPRNATLIFSGPFPPEDALRRAEKTLGAVGKGGDAAAPIPPFPDTCPGSVEERIPLKANGYALLMFLPHDPALYHPLQVLQSYLGEGENALLKTRVQDRKFWVLHAGALFYPAQPGFLVAFYSLHLPLFKTYNFKDIVLKSLSALAERGIEEKRLLQIKGRLGISMLSSLHGTEKKTLRLAECAILRGNIDFFFKDETLLAELSDAQVRDAARRLLEAPKADVLLKGSLWKSS